MASADSSESLPGSIGFIGLGAMGTPMVVNLATKLPHGSQIYVHDVVVSLVEELCTSFPDRVVKCVNAKEVTEKSVGPSAQTNCSIMSHH